MEHDQKKEAVFRKMEEVALKDKKEREQGLRGRKLSRFNKLSDWSWNSMYDEKFYIPFDEVCKETAERYGLGDKDLLGDVTMHVFCQEISLGEFPFAIEAKCNVSRKQALQAAIRLSRHILKEVSEHEPIGNVDAYVEEWKEEVANL
jgi:hypothetical protein